MMHRTDVIVIIFLALLSGDCSGKDAATVAAAANAIELKELSMKELLQLNEKLAIEMMSRQRNLGTASKLEQLYTKYKTEFPDGSPLIVACEKGRFDDVRTFVENHTETKFGMKVSKMINQKGTDSHGNDIGWTCLMVAAAKEHHDIVQFLLKHGADIRITDNAKRNALHWACSSNENNLDTIRLLVKQMNPSLDINSKHMWGHTALDQVYKSNHGPIRDDIIRFLRDNGAKTNKHTFKASSGYDEYYDSHEEL